MSIIIRRVAHAIVVHLGLKYITIPLIEDAEESEKLLLTLGLCNRQKRWRLVVT